MTNQAETGMSTLHEHISLDGDWRVIFDHDNKGRTLGLQETVAFYTQEDIETVTVPSVLEEYRQDYEGVAWYHRSFKLEPGFEGRVSRLHFGAANYRTEAWLNGQPIGFHEGGYTDFAFDVSAILNFENENDLIIRIITPLIQRDVVIDGLARDEAPHWRGAIGGGIWQPVTLLVSGPVYSFDPFIRPNLADGEVAVGAKLSNETLEPIDTVVECVVKDLRSGEVHSEHRSPVQLEPGRTDYSATIDMGEFTPWTPDNPRLYELSITLQSPAGASHSESVRFGMREFSVRGTQFTLNGEPFRIKGAFYEGFYPHSLVFPRDLSVLKKTFQNAKDAGLNLVRPWRKPQPPVVYDLADEMGLLMVGALPIECMEYWPRMTPQIYRRIDQEIAEMIVRDRNHTSIVMWEMFNELWRLPLISYKHKACLVAREQDPDRLILDEAGGFAGNARMYLPGSRTPFEINDIHRYAGGPLNTAGYAFFQNLAKTADELAAEGVGAIDGSTRSSIKPGLLTNISEIGYGSMPDLAANRRRYLEEGNPRTPDYRINERLLRSYTRVLEETGLMEVFGSLDAFVQLSQQVHSNANKLMVEACRLNPKIGGIMVHALTGGDWVVGAGLLDAFGEPKAAYYGTKKAFEPRYLAITPSLRNPIQGEEIQLKITGINDEDAVTGRLTITVTNETGKTRTLADSVSAKMPSGISSLSSVPLTTGGLSGHCVIAAELRGSGPNQTIAQNSADLYVMEPFEFRSLDLSLLDAGGAIAAYAASADYSLHDFTIDVSTSVPLIVSGLQASEVMQDVADWVARGGKAVVLDLPEGEFTPHTVGHRQTVRGYLPMDVTYMQGHDLWSPSNHVLKDHPIFAGLPVETVFDTVFAEVKPHRSIVSHRDGWIAGAVFYHYYGRQSHKQNFTGVSEADYGADLVPIPHGSGEFYVCTIQLAQGIIYDRFAQRLLYNMTDWLGCGAR